jgi:transcription antitermination factor NusA-like protein
VSRTHKGFLKRLFELEVPEIHSGTVEIKAIAREAGSRSKVAVASRQDGLDPVGATVGQRGARVQAVVAELSGEKIDVIPWSDDASLFVANALSPAQVISVDIDEEHRIASVTVPERMLSLAIGREGQNARLAARLTGWRIDIRSDVSVAEARAAAADAATNGTSEAQVADTEAVAAQAAGGETAEEAVPAAKPKRTTKKAAAAVAEADSDAVAAKAETAPAQAADAKTADEAVPAAKPKRTTKKAAAVADPDTDAGAASATAGGAPEETAPAAKPKRASKKAATTEPTEEVAS